MIPFLKNRQESSSSMGDEDEPIRRKADGEEEMGMLDAIAEDMISALGKKDKVLLKGALEALCEYIRDEDQEQDQMDQ